MREEKKEKGREERVEKRRDIREENSGHVRRSVAHISHYVTFDLSHIE
jgi:hypothetical protein